MGIFRIIDQITFTLGGIGSCEGLEGLRARHLSTSARQAVNSAGTAHDSDLRHEDGPLWQNSFGNNLLN